MDFAAPATRPGRIHFQIRIILTDIRNVKHKTGTLFRFNKINDAIWHQD